MKWKRTCHRFAEVRDLIDTDDLSLANCLHIMYALEACCDELTPDYDEEWDYYEDFRDLKSEIHTEAELLDVCDCQYVVNNYLEEFYNLCDSASVWLTLLHS